MRKMFCLNPAVVKSLYLVPHKHQHQQCGKKKSLFNETKEEGLWLTELFFLPGCGASDEDEKDRSGFSEHELLEIMYDACNSSNTGIWHLIFKRSTNHP